MCVVVVVCVCVIVCQWRVKYCSFLADVCVCVCVRVPVGSAQAVRVTRKVTTSSAAGPRALPWDRPMMVRFVIVSLIELVPVRE